MKKNLPLIAVLGWILCVGLAVAWSTQRVRSGTLASQVQSLESELELLEGKHRGLLSANAELQARKALVDLPPLPEPTAVMEPEPDEPPQIDAGSLVSNAENPGRQRPTRTPEEQAQAEARAKEIEARREEWRQRRTEVHNTIVQGTQDRRNFFAQLDTTGLAPEYVANHNRLLEVLDSVETFFAAVNDESLPEEERRALRQQMRETMGEVNNLMAVERTILLSDYADALQLSGADAQQFVEAIDAITEMTTPPRMFGRGMGGGRSGEAPRPPAP